MWIKKAKETRNAVARHFQAVASHQAGWLDTTTFC
jgi:hypothetical protein